MNKVNEIYEIKEIKGISDVTNDIYLRYPCSSKKSFNELLDDEITQFSVNMDPYITIFIGFIVTIGVGIIINLIQII